MMIKARLERQPGEWINLFNSGIVIDLKKGRIDIVNALIKLNEIKGKTMRKGGKK